MKTIRVRAVEGRPVNALDARGNSLTREVGRFLSGEVMPEGELLPEPLHPLYRACLASGDLAPWEPPAASKPAPSPEAEESSR